MERGLYEVCCAPGKIGGGRAGVGIGAANGVSTRIGLSNSEGEAPRKWKGMSAFGVVSTWSTHEAR
jgi:hypothetical protein